MARATKRTWPILDRPRGRPSAPVVVCEREKAFDADVRELIVAPVREHSRKPAETRTRIAQPVPGPYLELFARSRAEGWDA